MNGKIVEYDKYCYQCVNKDVCEVENPCNECLDNPVREDTKKPLHFKLDDKAKAARKRKDK